MEMIFCLILSVLCANKLIYMKCYPSALFSRVSYRIFGFGGIVDLYCSEALQCGGSGYTPRTICGI